MQLFSKNKKQNKQEEEEYLCDDTKKRITLMVQWRPSIWNQFGIRVVPAH